jgi:hypothetical protein
MGGGSSKQKSTQKSSSKTFVNADQREQLKSLWSRAGDLSNEGPYSYGQDRVAAMDEGSERALGSAGGQYAQGQENLREANDQTNSTLRGDYLGPESNPWLKRTHDVGVRNMTRGFYNATNALGSRMEAAGRTGGGAHAAGQGVADENLATGIGDYTAKLYGDNYQQERNRQVGAVGQASGNTQAGWQNIAGYAAAGDRMQEQRQAELSDMVSRFQFDQQGTATKLAEFSQMIGGPVMEQRSKGKQKSRQSEGHGGLFTS